MEKTCPMDTDLEGDNWCSLQQKDIVYYNEDGNVYCYKIVDVLKIIHQEFTALDTSYQLPPLRLNLPRDSFNRSVFPLKFIDAVVKKIKRNTITADVAFPEVMYFLRHRKRFYQKLEPFLTQREPNKVQLSQAIEGFLKGSRNLVMKRDTRNQIRWDFKNRVPMAGLYHYVKNR